MFTNYCTGEMTRAELQKIIEFHKAEIGTDYEINHGGKGFTFSAMFFEITPKESEKLAYFENSRNKEKTDKAENGDFSVEWVWEIPGENYDRFKLIEKSTGEIVYQEWPTSTEITAKAILEDVTVNDFHAE